MTKKIAFLDRDGVINKKAGDHCYITKKEDFIFNEGIFELLEKLRDSGFEFIVITNQRGVFRGMYSEYDLRDIHSFMSEELKKKNISLLDIFYCPHDNNVCNCRKPKPGMLKMACDKYDIDLRGSIFITDSENELRMGDEFGIGKTYLIESDKIRIPLGGFIYV